jgi:hypothetical protein
VWKPALVIVVFGVLAAVFLGALAPPVLPDGESPEAALASELGTLRQAVQLYRAQHDGLPDAHVVEQLLGTTDAEGHVVAGGPFGPYLRQALPANPINHDASLRCVDRLPVAPSGDSGWYYVPATGELRANVAGLGPSGVAYFLL